MKHVQTCANVCTRRASARACLIACYFKLLARVHPCQRACTHARLRARQAGCRRTCLLPCRPACLLVCLPACLKLAHIREGVPVLVACICEASLRARMCAIQPARVDVLRECVCSHVCASKSKKYWTESLRACMHARAHVNTGCMHVCANGMHKMQCKRARDCACCA